MKKNVLYNVKTKLVFRRKIFTVNLPLSSLFWKSLPQNTVRDRDGTIGKVYRLLPQAGAGVTVHRQVGSGQLDIHLGLTPSPADDVVVLALDVVVM